MNNFAVVWGFIVKLPITTDVYAEWQKFIKDNVALRHIPHDEFREKFIDELFALGKAENINENDVVPDTVADEYFSWFFMIDDILNERTPSSEDMLLYRSAFPQHVGQVSIRDQELYATGYKTDDFKDAQYTQSLYLKWLADDDVVSLEDKKIFLFRSWMKRNERLAIDKQGFAINNVFSNDPKDLYRRFSYSTGLNDKFGFEAILINGGDHSGRLLASVLSRIVAGEDILSTNFVIPEFIIGEKGSLRAKFIDIPLSSEAAKNMLANGDTMSAVKQLLVGDKNNILPGESGYDDSFIQEFRVVQ